MSPAPLSSPPAQVPSDPSHTSASKAFTQLPPSEQLIILKAAAEAATAKQQANHAHKPADGGKGGEGKQRMEWDEKMTLEEKSKLGDAFGAYVIVEGENEGDVRDDSGDEFKFEVVPGFFRQSDGSKPKVAVADMLANSFGLEDRSENRWGNFKEKIADLNKNAPENVQYKVMFCGRHGQGWHNFGAEQYDPVSWELDWAKRTGDGHITWGPDPELTPLGVHQAQLVHEGWKQNLKDGCPKPERWLASPFTRAIDTMLFSFGEKGGEGAVGIMQGKRAEVWEGVREIYGIHTCDLRRTKTDIAAKFPMLDFEPGFEEEDPYWKPDEREAEGPRRRRLRAAMFKLFGEDKNTYISISSHSCALRSLLAVVNHTPLSLETGEMIPVVVKATRQK